MSDSRYSSDGSTLTFFENSSDTSISVTTPSGPLWTTGEVFDIMVEGERMTVTNVAGATSPQIFTVIRSVNGIVKSHRTETSKVELYSPAVYAY